MIDKQAEKTKIIKNQSDSSILLCNAPKYNDYVCPKCCSVLSKKNVEISILRENGDFFGYFVYPASYCHNCKKKYIIKEVIIWGLKRLPRHNEQTYKVELGNAYIQYDRQSKHYLDYPTIDIDDAIYSPKYNKPKPSEQKPSEMNLNQKSFLGKMGYNTSKLTGARQNILRNAVKLYGKDKVINHLQFLIDTRCGQTNGTKKFANAIYAWQKDLIFVLNLE